jgi:two-component system response regulator
MNASVANTQARPAEVLLIEDNIRDVLLTRKAFQVSRIPCNITVANNADEAFAILAHEGNYASFPIPDLILLDLNLPKMNGKDLLMKIKAHPGIKNIPVIVLTSSHAETDIIKSYELEAHTYIVKPVKLDQQTFIEDLLERRIRG